MMTVINPFVSKLLLFEFTVTFILLHSDDALLVTTLESRAIPPSLDLNSK